MDLEYYAGPFSPPLVRPPSPNSPSVNRTSADAKRGSSEPISATSKQPRPTRKYRSMSAQSLDRLELRPLSPEPQQRPPFGTCSVRKTMTDGPGRKERRHRKGLSVSLIPTSPSSSEDHNGVEFPKVGLGVFGSEFGAFCGAPPTPGESVGSSSPAVGLSNSPAVLQQPSAIVAAEVAGFQDILEALAHKERQVLEARQALDERHAEWCELLKQVQAISGPTPVPLVLPWRPRPVPRIRAPAGSGIGIHSLTYTRVRKRMMSRSSSSSSSSSRRRLDWSVDDDAAPNSLDHSSIGSSHSITETIVDEASVARRFVLCLLYVTYKVAASMIPLHRMGLGEDPYTELRPDFPSPSCTLYFFWDC